MCTQCTHNVWSCMYCMYNVCMRIYTKKNQKKRPRPRISPEHGHTLCASLRNRNACQQFTRATLHGNLEEKCRRPERASWSSTGLYTYSKSPSVWIRCLGNHHVYKFSFQTYFDTAPLFRGTVHLKMRYGYISYYSLKLPLKKMYFFYIFRI
jgi:hypothetical protein